jgi:hypothetical protein
MTPDAQSSSLTNKVKAHAASVAEVKCGRNVSESHSDNSSSIWLNTKSNRIETESDRIDIESNQTETESRRFETKSDLFESDDTHIFGVERSNAS